VLDELAERICMRIQDGAQFEGIGPKTVKWIQNNLGEVRSHLYAVLDAEEVEEHDGWAIWVVDSVERLEVREITQLVLVPTAFKDAPACVWEWARDCAKAHKRIRPPLAVYDWLWDAKIIGF